MERPSPPPAPDPTAVAPLFCTNYNYRINSPQIIYTTFDPESVSFPLTKSKLSIHIKIYNAFKSTDSTVL